MEFLTRKFDPPKGSFFLFGARGTGKSTWLSRHYPHALKLDLLLPNTFFEYQANPERLISLIESDPSIQTVIIDEIQRLPLLLDVVHHLIEKYPHLTFILTGSSARKLKQTGVNLLAGRAVIKKFHPFTADELGKKFKLDQALQTGLLPIVLGSKNPEEVLHAYIGVYLEEEVHKEALVRNLATFSRFLTQLSFSHASQLNLSNIAREVKTNSKLIEAYLSIVEDLLLGYRIPVFTKRAKRSTVGHPKFYFFDTGVFRALRPTGPLDPPSELSGLALEGLVFQHLQAFSDRNGDSLFYWRTKGGAEVDFILYGKTHFWAIEVKYGSSWQKKDLRHLLTFKEEYPEAALFFLYRGKEKHHVSGIDIIPVEDFLKRL